MTRKIAILKECTTYDKWEDEHKLIEKITDFAEVDDETYNLLSSYQWSGNYRVIEIPTNINQFVADTVAKYAEEAKKLEEKRKKEEEKRKKAQAEAEKKRKAKAEERKRKQLEKLLKELGPLPVSNAS